MSSSFAQAVPLDFPTGIDVAYGRDRNESLIITGMDATKSSSSTNNSTRDELQEWTSRKEQVDKAFSDLLKNVFKYKPPPPPQDTASVNGVSVHDSDSDEPHFDGDKEDDLLQRSSDEERNSENLDDFSGLDDLNLSEDEDEIRRDGIIELKRKKPENREYAPHGRKQRGYHKWAGRVVALLSTGETGKIAKIPGGRIKVKLDGLPGFEISSSEEKLHLVEATGPDAILEIFEAARYVPQLKDLKINQRVAMLRYDNATGRILKLPEERRAMNGLGHVIVKLDVGGDIRKSVIESLRLIDDNHERIALPPPVSKSLGRPTKAVQLNKSQPPAITPLIPHSKRGDIWRRDLKAPSSLSSPPSSPAHSSASDGDAEKEHRVVDGVRLPSALVKRVKPDPNRPHLTRGQKLCKTCNRVIGTASRTCLHCGAQCVKTAMRKEI